MYFDVLEQKLKILFLINDVACLIFPMFTSSFIKAEKSLNWPSLKFVRNNSFYSAKQILRKNDHFWVVIKLKWNFYNFYDIKFYSNIWYTQSIKF